MPMFSVLMASHLRAPLLARALASLAAQTWQDFETLVVADAWDAASAQAAATHLRAQDRFLKRDGAPGPAASRNEALALARGEWIVFLDDDDSFQPHHLQRLADVIAAAPTVDCWFSGCAVLTEDRALPGMPTLSAHVLELSAHDPAQLWVKNFIPNHALAYRRRLLHGLRFDEHMDSLEDWDFLLGVCSRSLPRHYAGGGAVMHKDYVNPGTRRGTSDKANDGTVLQDFLYAYRRWPAPTPELQAARQALLGSAGLGLPIGWF